LRLHRKLAFTATNAKALVVRACDLNYSSTSPGGAILTDSRVASDVL